VQDLIKSSARLDEDDKATALGTQPEEGGSTPTPDTDPGTLLEPTNQARELGLEVAPVPELSISDRTDNICFFSIYDSKRYRTANPRPIAWHAGPKGTSFMMMSCIIAVLPESFSDAFPSRKVWHYFLTFMKEYVDIMLRPGAWSEKPSSKAFNGQRPPSMWSRL
jgi:hypothetical protein